MTVTSAPATAVRRADPSASPLASLRWQVLAVLTGVAAAAAMHWTNDGLWFQGDAPRHAANGLFFWDLVSQWPRDPLGYTLQYYARYPVITPLAYPPLFYLLEGTAFRIAGPSAQVAKLLVLACAAISGLYTALWARRWISTPAGWAGACVVLMPGFVLYGNAVLLNVPATALGLATLYHLRRWIDTSAPGQARLTAALVLAMVLTYYPSIVVLPVAGAWLLASGRATHLRLFWLVPAVAAGLVLASVALMPAFVARHAPSVTRAFTATNWRFYADEVPRLTGLPWLLLALFGLAGGLLMRSSRGEAARLGLGVLVVLSCLAVLPAMDARYALILVPFAVLLAANGLAGIAGQTSDWRPALLAGTAVIAAGLSVQSVTDTRVPAVSGFEDVVRYLRSHARGDTVLYSGRYDGVFGFYTRALDPGFDQRVIFSPKLLYRSEETSRFMRVDTPFVSSTADVVDRVRHQCGCRWVVFEAGPDALLTRADALLKQTLEASGAFEPAGSFPIRAGSALRLDVYRLSGPVDPTPPADLSFPSFTDRVFRGITPIERRSRS